MAIETIYRQKAPHNLTEAQKQAKLAKDSQYEIDVQNLSTAFYKKKRTTGVTPQEEDAYKSQKAKLWNDYYQWAISEGLYEKVTPEQQLAEVEHALEGQLNNVNAIRVKLGRKPYELKEAVK